MGSPLSHRSTLLLALVVSLLPAPEEGYARTPPSSAGPISACAPSDEKLDRIRDLAEQIVKVPSNELRTRLLSELIEESRGYAPAAEVIRGAILELWEKSHRRLGGKSNQRVFSKLLDARRELDELRASTLSLIRDESLYPYPHQAPDATPDAIQRFSRAQTRIDGAVEKMRAIWRKSPEVRVPALMQEQLALALWTRRANKRTGEELAVSATLPRPEFPPWVFGLPLKGELPKETVTLASFGLSLQEARELALGRAILELNASRLEEALVGVSDRFEEERIRTEFDQVRVTNEYRQLFGLQVLAWDTRLFAACRQHADYLRESGQFGHHQPTEEFGTFTARARRAGYPKQVYENCHQGSHEPFDVLMALTHSSEHHRTVLLEIASEMATARAGLAWVQNYGLDTGFLSAIQWEAWRD